MNSYILSIDAGTTGITILIINKDANICKKYYQEFTQHYPKPGWVEHDANEIWEITKKLIILAFKENNPKYCLSIGITNQRETTLIWNRKNSRPIHNAIVWQCRRTKYICEKLKKINLEKEFYKRTGLMIDSYFSGTKIKWLLDNYNEGHKKAQNGDLIFGTIDSWLLWKLTGGKKHATDFTNASRTLIFNIKNMIWDEELLKILNIPFSLLPEVMPSSGTFGETDIKLFNISIPITGIAGDQQSALFGQGCINPGDTKCTYGTGSFLLTNTGEKRIESSNGLITTIACDINGKPVYALEGSVFIGGAIIQWLRDELKLLENAADSDEMARNVNNNNGVCIVPAFTGLGAPYWNMDAHGIITGLTRGSNRYHIVRAALESIAFQVKDILDIIKIDMKQSAISLKVDGGASANNFLMQFQSNILDQKIERPYNIESTALGVGMLAGLEIGFWDNIHEIIKFRKIDRFFTPDLSNKDRTILTNQWETAVRKAQCK